MDLAKFLLARIAEDEAAIGQRDEPESWCDRADGYHLDRKRATAECDAKRRIVESHRQAEADDDMEMTGSTASWNDGYVCGLGDALKLLALPYADHPDYQAEWSPDVLTA